MSTGQDDVFLNDVWTLHFHNPDDSSWDENSYIRLCDISSVDDIIHVYKAYKDLWQNGMFFFMREHIKPMWEDPSNRDGGCMSFKIMKYDLNNVWFEVISKILGECFVLPKDRAQLWSKISGVSISSKRSYCICRIWISDKNYGEPQWYDMDIVPTYTQILFKAHNENKDFVIGENHQT